MPADLPAHIPAPLPPAAAPAPARAPAPAGGPAPRRIDVPRLLRAVLAHRWLVLGATLAGLGAGAAAARFTHPQYVAQGTVWIEDTETGTNQGPIRSAGLLRSYAWVELLRSYTVLDSVVAEQKLFVQPGARTPMSAFASFRLGERFRPGAYRLTVAPDGAYVLATQDGAEIQRVRAGEPVGAPAGFAWVPPAQPRGGALEFNLQNPRDVARALGQQLETRMMEDGHFLQMTLAGTDPERIARTLNATLTRYVAVAAQLKRARLVELTDILEEQRQYAERNLRDAESSLEAFRVRTVTLPSDEGTPVAPGLQLTQAPVYNSYFGMKVSREDLRRDREALERILAQAATAGMGYDAVAVVPAVQANPEVQQLLAERTTRRAELRALQQRYTDEHPPVRRAAADLQALESTSLPAAVRQLVGQLASREAEMETRIASASTELRQIPPRAIEEARLRRRVDIANNLYGVLRQRYEEARLAAVSSLPDLRVLDSAAVPFAPVSDPRPLLVAGGAAAGLALALLIVFLIDRADRRVRYPEEVAAMGVPILGAVPAIRGAVGEADGRSMVQLAEAFRELRLAVGHAHGGGGPLFVSVTSPESGDGKSTVAAALARAFAEQGHRTLLVDGDIRRGNLHRVLGCSRVAGLTDCLMGRHSLADALQAAPGVPFAFLASGTRMQRGPELLGSPAMGRLMAELRTRFGVVVVDTPPLSAGVDAYLLGTHTGSVLLVVRAGSTDGELTEAKLALLDRLPVRVLGAVLNAIPDSRIYRAYGYLPGYAAEDEALPPAAAVG